MPPRPVSAPHLELGARGEDAAAELLVSKGYRLLHRNWTSGNLELDLVAEKGDEVVIVEVKTRSSCGTVDPAATLSPAKAKRLLRAASEYLSAHDLWNRPCRVDLMVVASGPGGLTLEHLPDAVRFEDAGGWQPW